MRFAQPLMLVLLPLLAWIVWRGRRAGVRRAVVLLRVAAAAALVLAAAGLSLRYANGSAAVVFVVDRSASIPAREQLAAVARAARHTTQMHAGDRAALVLFGGDAVVDRPLAARPLAPEAGSAVPQGATDVEQALRVARTILPAEGTRRIVLLSDGRETQGDAAMEARTAAAAGINVDAVALAIRTDGAPRISDVRAPATVRVGEAFRIAVHVQGHAGSSADVIVRRGGARIGVLRAKMDGSGAAVVAVEDRADVAGPVTYTAGVMSPSADDSAEAGAVVIASGTPAILYVSGAESPLRGVLDPSAYRIHTVTPVSLPAAAGALTAYDAVVLDDVAAGDMSESQARVLAEYVERIGGGLLLRGSERVLDPSGYTRSPLGAALPIDLRHRRGSRAPDLALAIVFDKSGSMDDMTEGVTKIELARRAVVAVQEVLPAGDSLGVIAFDAQPSIVAPLAAGHDAEDLRRRLRQIDANGPTAIAPAVKLAYEWLRASRAARRQILLLSDGRSTPEDAAALLAMSTTPGVSLSVVATGADVDRALFRDLAARAGGRVFFPDDVRSLPEILAREAARASGGWRVTERFVARVPNPHPLLAGIDRSDAPTLDGYVAAAARTGAETPLESHLGDPLLAVWRFGLGRVAVFTGDLSPVLQRWPAYTRLWRQTIRYVGRGPSSSILDARLEPRHSGAALVVDAVDERGAFLNGLSGSGTITTPSGESRAVAMRQTAPGQYEAAFEPTSSGAHVVALELRDESGARELMVRRGLYWLPPAERPGLGADLPNLTAIVQNGGGRVLGQADDPFDVERQPAYRDVSNILAVLALILFVIDIAMRRGVTLKLLRGLGRRHQRVPGEAAPV